MPQKKSKPAKSGPFKAIYAKSRRKKGRSGIFRALFRLCSVLTALGVALSVIGSFYFGAVAQRYDMNVIKEVPQRTLVFDKQGKLLGHLSGHGENRLVVDASEVSDHFINALLAREDSRFYEHGGIDYVGVIRAVLLNLRAGGFDQGASTLTMQLAKNAYGNKDKTIRRKLLEVAIAKRIERNYSKNEILGFYMNRIYFGSGLYGIERASQGFFMKPASELSPGEGAMLAGVIRGPSLLNPFRSLKDAQDTRDEVLARMVAEKLISEADATEAKTEAITLRPPDKRLATGSYNLQTVFDLLSDFLAPEDIENGGLKIHTTLDAKIQSSAEKSLDNHLTRIESRPGFQHPEKGVHQRGEATRYLQGAVVSLDNSSGAILAMVGGRSFGDSAFNRVYRAQRQVGSTFKPFVYANAFETTGLLPGAYVNDDPIRLSHNGGPVWSPQNSDGTFTGLQPSAIGLIRSRNTMSIRVGQLGGINNVRELARTLKFGEIPDSPVIYLGAFETTPMTVTSAMSIFAAKGVNYTPYLIERIENSDGDLLYQNQIRATQVLRESTAWMTADILGEVMSTGTGVSARNAGYTVPSYGKTGTTNDYRDAWFVGFTDKITTGVWVGLDQPKTIMKKGYGSTLALPVWTEVMKTAENSGYAAKALPLPPGCENTILCRECGLLASKQTLYPYQMPLPPDRQPSATCRGHGLGPFAGMDRQPRAYSMPGGLIARPINSQRSPLGEGDFGNKVKKIGRFLFGGTER
jgi:penicillin-binding protein 1A